MVNNKIFNLTGKIALVTGGSRGIGKGVAKELVEAGAKVFITGRKKPSDSKNPTVMDTAEELNKLQKGTCHGIFCNHSNAYEINAIFKSINRKNKKLDILVNSVMGTDKIEDIKNKNFWDVEPIQLWDDVMNVGMRSAYICSVNASKMMIPKKSGSIINISSMGSLFPVFGTLYCVGKEGTDRMSVNMGIELKKHGITVLSLWPSIVRTERNEKLMKNDATIQSMWKVAEDPELIGRVVASISNSKNPLRLSSRIHYVADLAHKFGLKNNDGKIPLSPRSYRFLFSLISPNLSKLFHPGMKVPMWSILLLTSKFSKYNQHIFQIKI